VMKKVEIAKLLKDTLFDQMGCCGCGCCCDPEDHREPAKELLELEKKGVFKLTKADRKEINEMISPPDISQGGQKGPESTLGTLLKDRYINDFVGKMCEPTLIERLKE